MTVAESATATMYSTCLFCQSTLGSNELIETFPVGRRIAFDAEKGRLWVICLHCREWNLTPLDERWEAVEECERAFRGTRVRVSTNEIGMARLRAGLDLVRVGRPLRPEFAAWRYGAQMGKRRRRALAAAGAATAVGGAVIAGGAVAAAAVAVPFIVLWQLHKLPAWLQSHRVVARVPAGQRWSFVVRGHHLDGARLLPESGADGWALQLAYDGGERRFTGHAGVRATAHLMAGVNRFGASTTQVDGAVSLVDQAGDPQRYVAHVARRAQELGSLAVAHLPAEVRLALEMSAHEEAERRAMEGELAELRDAWEAAEAVARIADDLLVPRGVDELLRRFRTTSPRSR